MPRLGVGIFNSIVVCVRAAAVDPAAQCDRVLHWVPPLFQLQGAAGEWLNGEVNVQNKGGAGGGTEIFSFSDALEGEGWRSASFQEVVSKTRPRALATSAAVGQ